MIRIENKRTYQGDGFYVGRPTPLGNPFPMDSGNGRVEVIERYRIWLLKKLETNNPTTRAFLALVDVYQKTGELILICWCAPLACHAEVIRDFIMEMAE